MRKLLAYSVIFLATIAAVQPANLYRNGREIIVEDLGENVVADLRRDEKPLEIEVAEPVILINEDVAVPVDSLRKTEPVVDVQEPVAILNEVDTLPHIRDQIYEIPVQVIGLESNVNEEAPDTFKQDEEAVPVNFSESESVNQEPSQEEGGLLLKQQAPENAAFPATSTSRPNLIQQVLANNPFQQFVDTIRRPLTTPRADGDVAAIATTQNPNIFQQIQTGIQTGFQNFTNAVSSVFQPPQNNLETAESAQSASTVRPNPFESFQQNVANTFNNIFRPQTEQQTAGTQQPGPIQAVLQNVQNFLTGNRVTPSQTVASPASDKPEKLTLPVDDKVDYTLSQRSSEEFDPVVEDQPAESSASSIEDLGDQDVIEARKAEKSPTPDQGDEDKKV